MPLVTVEKDFFTQCKKHGTDRIYEQIKKIKKAPQMLNLQDLISL